MLAYNDNLDVLTQNGIKNLFQVTEEDQSLNFDNEWVPIKIKKDTYKGLFYTFKAVSGLPITSTPEQLFWTIPKEQIHPHTIDFIPKLKQAQDIKRKDCLLIGIDDKVENIQQVNCGDIMMPITPELLELIGIYVSLGTFSKEDEDIYFFTSNQEVIEKIAKLSKIFNSHKDIVSFLNNLSTEWIRYLNPDLQFYYVKGLFQKKTVSLKPIARYYTDNKQIVYDIVHILNRLHINPSIKFYAGHYTIEINNNFGKFLAHCFYQDKEYKYVYDKHNVVYDWNGHKYLKFPVYKVTKQNDTKEVCSVSATSFTICNIKCEGE